MAQQVFPSWSTAIPSSLAQTFLEEDGYWHAWDGHRSVSLSSFTLMDGDQPVPAGMIVRQIPPGHGVRVRRLPPDLVGWGIEAKAVQPAPASWTLSGVLAADGRVLLATITSDDIEWSRETWRSIRCIQPWVTTTGHTGWGQRPQLL